MDFSEARTYAQATFCTQPCTTLTFSFGLPKYSDVDIAKDEGFIKLYFKSQINVRNSMLSYDIETFVADIGGYLGLLLGFSLLDVTRVIKQIFSYYWDIIQSKVKQQSLQRSSDLDKTAISTSTLKINKKTYSVYTINKNLK